MFNEYCNRQHHHHHIYNNQHQAPGNAGLWDQLAALQWVQILFSNQTQMKYYDLKIQIQKNTSLVPFQVQENIAAFGGDPDKVNNIL